MGFRESFLKTNFGSRDDEIIRGEIGLLLFVLKGVLLLFRFFFLLTQVGLSICLPYGNFFIFLPRDIARNVPH